MYFRPFSTATAIALALSAQSAAALTPDETWAAIQAAANKAGQTMTAASTATAGDTLTATDVQVAIATPEGLSMTTVLPTLAFRDRGDGTVEVIYPATFDSALTFPDGASDAPKTMTLTFVHDALSIIASGEAAAPKYDLSAKAFTGMVKDVKDASGKPMTLTGVINLTGLAGSYAMPASGEMTSYDSSMTAASLAITAEGKDPEGFAISGTLSATNLSSTGKTVMVDPAQMQANLAAALASGVMVDTEVSTGPVALSVKVDDAAQSGGFDATFASTAAHVFLDKSRLDYGFSLAGANMVARGMDMPFPEVATAFSDITLGFVMPVSASDQPQDFSALARFTDLTLTEDIWAMFDPGARLPRDPVSFVLDLKGTGAWTVDILDPAAQIQDGPELPAKLFTLDLTQLLAKAAGAQVVGTGALTFDNANLAALGGFPAPNGKVTFTLTGINALLDALVAIGMVPEDELMSVRMGLAMLARPGAGPDELISDIEFKEGALFINGQPME